MPEVWLRGPVTGVPAALQPVAHALLQVAEEVEARLAGFPDDLLWTKPAGVASVGFHLQHLVGVVDRLFTYAEGRALAPEQVTALRSEEGPRTGGVSTAALVRAVSEEVVRAVDRLRTVEPATLTDARKVGRAGLPSTVLGLLFHAAEHSQRHLGQLLVTVRVVTVAVSPPGRARA